MNVICSDKTGTLTEGSVHVQAALDVAGAPSEQVLLYAYLNAFYETGFTNPIDAAIRTHRQFDLSGYRKVDEIPYDFLRKRLSILVAHEETHLSESHTCIWAEERLLMERYPAYFAYAARTKRVIPFVA
jgi:Mg2+-importing ATPase